MNYEDRVTLKDWDVAQRLADGVLVGSAFLFIKQDALARPGRSGGRHQFKSAAPRPQVCSLLGPEPVHLPGITLKPLPLPPLRLACVTSDKALYREGRDEVHLFALDLLAPNTEAVLEVRAGGAGFTRQPLRLDRHGLAIVILRDLPAGEYDVRFQGDPVTEPLCAFTVAGYRLAPLVASFVDRRLEGAPPRLALRLQLMAFGLPVEGGVRLELTDRFRRVDEVRAVARGGLVEASFRLEGEGPHAVQVQLEDEPSRTATVPITGSRRAERSLTTFSTLGAEVTGSLLPGADSRPVRGLFLHEGADRSAPFRLERVDTHRARLIAQRNAEAVRVVLMHPASMGVPPREVVRASFSIGEVIELSVPVPLGLLAVGAFVDGTPWEGWAAVLRPEALTPQIHVPPRCAPGDEVAIDVETGPAGEAAVYLVVKDARLLTGETPAGRLGGGLKDFVATASERLAVGQVTRPLAVLLHRDFADVLLTLGAVSVEQLEEARNLRRKMGGRLQNVLVKLGYAAEQEVVRALADFHGLPCIDLAEMTIPTEVLELVPESVARENVILPLGTDGRTLQVVLSDPEDFDTIQKLEFILNRDVRPVLASRTEIVEAINRSYGQTETESVDSMLQEFTDTAIDFDGAILSPVALKVGAPPSCRHPPAVQAAGEQPEVLFAGLLPVRDGRARAVVRLGNGFTDYVAEAFVVAGLDWASAEARFRAAKDPFVALDLPAFVHPGDAAVGRLHVGAGSGRLRLRLTRNGTEVPLTHEGKPFPAGATIPAARTEVCFLAEAGEYEATVVDLASGTTDQAAGRVEVPGKLRRLARTLVLLEPGHGITRADDQGIVSLRVLPGLDVPFRALAEATADYSHCCCEQTAAEILAASAMYALADSDTERRARAEAILCTGVERETSMWLRGRGFKIYPQGPDVPDRYCGPLAARYLRDLALLCRAGGPEPPSSVLGEAVRSGLAMAEDAGTAYRLPWPPCLAHTCEEAYAVVRFNDDAGERGKALALVRKWAAGETDPACPPGLSAPSRWGIVGRRTEAAYAASVLLRAGGSSDWRQAVALANSVVKQIGPEGRLYSTIDSVAALALVGELRAARLVGGAGLVEIDGRRRPVTEAVGLVGGIGSVTAVDGAVAVEVARVVEEDWGRMAGQVPLRVALLRGGRAACRFIAGTALELSVKLVQGYQVGDLLWVCLPDALTRVVGGGQVKRFAVDFAGQDEVRVPLAATAVTVDRQGRPAPQRFAVCVRNMFEEERAGNPGLLEVTVVPWNRQGL